MKKTITVYCLPFAGGNKYSYREYMEKAPSFIKFVPLEYPGRGTRIKEPLVSDVHEIVDDLYQQISYQVDYVQYAIYGHSLGGLVAYLLTLKLRQRHHKAPLHLFITGTEGPSAPSRKEKKRYLMDKEEFVEEIRTLSGMPEEILQNDEMLHFLEPILRNDFRASEEYIYEDHAPLNIPITVITGTEEDVELPDVRLWQKETTHKVDFKQLPGNHFFIFEHAHVILEIMAKKLYVHTKSYNL
ncbi:MAG: thioesterase [Flavisolibacter sp.]|nr:thioesterase [Flavisolibacter sp.]